MAGIIGSATILGNFIIPVIIMPIGIIAIFICKSKVKEPLNDERTYKIGGMAALYTWGVYCIIASTTANIFTALSNRGYTWLRIVGFTLSFSVLFLTFLYIIFYIILNKKY